MLARLIAGLERDADRVLLAGVALVALGVVTTLRTLADAAGQWSDALPVGDRAVLGLYHTRPAHAVPFLIGAALVVLGLRLRHRLPGAGAGVVAGVAWAYVALGVVGALAAVYSAATGSFGEGAILVELSTRERTFGFAEQLIGSLAIAVAALAGARALLGTAEPSATIGLEDEEADDADVDDGMVSLFGEVEGNGRAPGAVVPLPGTGSDAARELPAPAPAEADLAPPPAPAPEPAPEVLGPAERYRRLYDRQLRFSPRAAQARTLLARLRDDPGDEETQAALDRLSGPDGSLD